MFLTLLLVILKSLDDINLEDTVVDNEQTSHPHHDLPNNGQLPPLVPLELPAELYENEAADVLDIVKRKLKHFFGETMTEEAMKIKSSDGVFDYLSKADFHNYLINGLINSVGDTLKSKELPLTGITSKKKCRKVCRRNQSGVMNYVQSSIQNTISSLTKEDFRFEFSQDPAKSFIYELDKETNTYQCKCTDQGHTIKVSPRLKQLIEKKFLKNGKPLSKILLEHDEKSSLAHFEDLLSWKKMTNLGLYLTGWKSRAKRDVDNDIGEFILYHGFITLILFVICPCIFYFYLIYVFFAFLNDFVL